MDFLGVDLIDLSFGLDILNFLPFYMCRGVLQQIEHTFISDFQCPRRDPSSDLLSLSPMIRFIM